MHEFSITQKLVELALKQAGPRKIVCVNLLIGPFSEEREDAIHFFWKDLAKNSPGEGAKLHFEHAPIEMKCLDCSGTFYLDRNNEDSQCKYCYSEHLQLLRGDDVRLKSIEVE